MGGSDGGQVVKEFWRNDSLLTFKRQGGENWIRQKASMTGGSCQSQGTEDM